MHANSSLLSFVSLVLLGGSITLQGCNQTVSVDTSGGDLPPAGVIQGTVSYVGPPPCSQNGHIVGNAVILVFDARNPPPPSGLGNTAINFGVVSGDVLFHNWPATPGATKICPAAGDPTQTVSASYAISPMSAGQYLIQAFFDYTGDFFATFKFRNLPEAMDVGGGYIDIDDATKLVPSLNAITLADGGAYYPMVENQSDPNYLPIFLPVNVGAQVSTPSISLRDTPTFTMPDNGYVADNVTVTLATTLPYSRPYFYPEGVNSTTTSATFTSQTSSGMQSPISTIAYNGLSSARPANLPAKDPSTTAQNPSGDGDFIPVVSFPQDIEIYAQPSVKGVTIGGPTILDQYQAALPSLVLHAGVPTPEQNVGADTASVTDPFHMQLGIAPSGQYVPSPGGNGGIFVWWNTERCPTGSVNCSTTQLDFIPEQPGEIYRMWPLVVLAKLEDLSGGGSQPNVNDPEALTVQGADLLKPAVIIQGITLYQDTVVHTTTANLGAASTTVPLSYPDPSNLADHVTVLLRPSTVCLDPRAPDHGGVVVVPGTIATGQGVAGTVQGSFPPADMTDINASATGTVVDSARLTNPQLAGIVNTKDYAGATNGMLGGCLPLGRYQVNMVYPTGQAWTTPNEEGSCAASEGATTFPAGYTGTNFTDDPLKISCATKPRPVLYSQGTRAVVEITAGTPGACAGFSATQKVPVDLNGNPTDGSPFVCSGLCTDPSLDPTALNAKTGIPCALCLDKTLDPTTSPPCTTKLTSAVPDAGH